MGAAGQGLGFISVFMFGGPSTWTDMPLAATELMGFPSVRARIPLEKFTQCCLGGSVIAASTSANTPIVFAQYSLDGTTWNALGTSISLAAAGTFRTAWADVAVIAKDQDVFVRAMGSGGDGVQDPTLANVWLGLR